MTIGVRCGAIGASTTSEREQGSTKSDDRARKQLVEHVEFDPCPGVYKETPIIPTPAIAQGMPMEPSAVHGIHEQPTTLGECGRQVVTTAKRIAVFLNLEPEGEFKTRLTDHDVTVVTYTARLSSH